MKPKQVTDLELDLTPTKVIYLIRANPFGRCRTNCPAITQTLLQQDGWHRVSKREWQDAAKRQVKS